MLKGLKDGFYSGGRTILNSLIWSLSIEYLDFRLKPSLKFFQRPETMGDFVLFAFVHLGVAVGN